jgi:hypothetical protein
MKLFPLVVINITHSPFRGDCSRKSQLLIYPADLQ